MLLKLGRVPAGKLSDNHVLLQAEAELWKRSEGYRVGWSDQILGFDCGGEQWVLEVAFPTGTLKCASFPGLKLCPFS